MTHLIDRYGRGVSYLRLSVTDRCDFRCVYCMAEEMTFLPKDAILSLEELFDVAAAFVAQGVNKIRLTGGEPLVRKDIVSLVAKISALKGLKELALTTNGSRLSQFAQPLKDAGLQRINISLDSLNPTRFRELTRTGNLQDVLDGIFAAKHAGFQRIKLNAVVLRGRNDDEILALVGFARQHDLDITFIEEMPLGAIDEHNRRNSFIASADVLQIISTVFVLTATTDSTGGPARYYRMPDSQTRIGFISPHSHNFCATCNRVRVTVEGRLLLCLGNEHSLDLRAIMRAFPNDSQHLINAIGAAMPLKPERHTFDDQSAPQIVRFMNMTGG